MSPTVPSIITTGSKVQRSVRQAEQRKQLDRNQWAGLDKVSYKLYTQCRDPGHTLNPEFDVTINFEGQLLKGYSHVYPLRSYEAPTEVQLNANGYGIAGPFWFGRAFDAPPFYSFSAVVLDNDLPFPRQITIGVVEWHQDERELYIGASLWFRVQCFPLDCCL